ERERRDFHLYIDEFQNFTTESFASILSEARKYRLCLVLSHQYFGQIHPLVRDAIFGNVGTHIAFRVGHHDAQLLAREFGDHLHHTHFSGLANHAIATKLLADGEQQAAFDGKSYPPRAANYGKRDTLIRLTREKYAS